jgi:group I intron endonuclease
MDHNLLKQNIYAYGCIYGLKSPSNKWYIGQTTKSDPINYIRINYERGDCGCRRKLKYAISKYGFNKFEIYIFIYCFSKEDLDKAEISFIQEFNSVENGYNLQLGGSNGKPSEETKVRISEAKAGMTVSDETKLKIKATLLGHEVSKETREKISKAQIGRVSSDETNEKRRIAMTGKKMSEEAKKKIGIASLGRFHSDESKKLNSEAHIKYEYELLSPIGKIFKTNNLRSFCKKELLNPGHLAKEGKTRGWTLLNRISLDETIIPNTISL